MKEKKIFLFTAASVYHVISKEVGNCIFWHNRVLDTQVCINKPYWQSSGIVIFMLLDVFFLLLTSWESKKETLSYKKDTQTKNDLSL